jgi:tetratricopeptide (TPR) repeat protein
MQEQRQHAKKEWQPRGEEKELRGEGMIEEKDYKSTEQEALAEEQREREWQETWGKDINLYLAKIDGLLAEGSSESRMKIKDMFGDREFFEHYKQVDAFAIMFVIMSIYELEDARGVSPTILEQADTVEGLLDVFFQFKMILYRLDFNVGRETRAEFLSFLKEHSVSTNWMGVMLTTSVLRPLTMALKLEKIFDDEGLQQLWLSILLFLQEYLPGNYRVTARIAAIYRENGQTVAAEGYQKRIPEIPDELQAQKELVFECQELLWKMQYKEAGADRSIVKFIKQQEADNALWEFVLEHCVVQDKEYYLRMAELLLDAEEAEKAEIALKRSLQSAPGDEITLCLLAEVAVKSGNIDNALAYLSQIENPSELAVKFQKTCMELKERRQYG